MTESDFLNTVLQAAGVHPQNLSGEPSEFAKSWTSQGPWESAAQVQIAYHLHRLGISAKVREIPYPHPYSSEMVDFYFKDGGETYAVEIKVESTNGNFGGMSLQEAITRDVNKLHGFKADNRWVVVVAASAKNIALLEKTLNRGDSWITDQEGVFAAYLCNIDTFPHGLPIKRYVQLNPPYNFITTHHNT
ncbi:hypothetical protein AB4Y40_40305 [Paraburkholderia sp. EG287B]|uniref:hypothetical protein n=1 Tax=Paraburkholderia sp. EG287B TaxID=3237010 RepID=UPI0034D24A6A